MGLVPVVVRLEDTTIAKDPVVGAKVRFYDIGDVFLTEETTDVDGKVDVLLDGAPSPGGTEYHVRAYKPGCSFGGPWTVTVFDPSLPPPDHNDFTMSVNIHEVQNSPTPGMCRASGVLFNADGRVLPNHRLIFKMAADGPRVLYDTLLLQYREIPVLEGKSDDEGFFAVDLVRDTTFYVVTPGWDEIWRVIKVSDRAGVRLADLIWPIPAEVVYDPAGPFSVHVGETKVITPTVTFSDYNTYVDGGDNVRYSSSDESVFTVARCTQHQLSITGVSAGAADLMMDRTDSAFVVVPTRPLVGGTTGVTVLP